ncbi:winged helix-turn-helix transcriptional regulator [Arthrobacter glacialis]|uniref:Transcriptional regulator n=1 Tax=Arthrobacter glacialis TaxID=1664 RepID=A0A2S3ZX78_ARTGL|nr:helix-turn-helix domain-containing protein [Arthrobacter glacialis]POH58988.1 transcriptional regulator [Arthrobacter glacialis]POH73542.1 transcriptional regulator [Arthrobacter glacialis]
MTVLEWDPYDRNCPSRQVLDRVGDRWTVLVVGALAAGPMRFSELAERVDGVSQKMLTQTLRNLERDGLVTRTMYAQIPPRVEYELTDSGTTLQLPMKALEDWTKEHMRGIMAARYEYDLHKAELPKP